MTQVNRLAFAGVDLAEVGFVELLRAHDVRHDDKDDVVILDGVILRSEDVFQDGNRAQTGNAGPVDGFLLVLDAAENAGLALTEADHLVHDALTDDGLGDAADGFLAALCRNLNLDLEGDVMIE